MHAFLHVLKFLCEGAAILFGVVALLIAFFGNTDSHDPTAAIGDAIGTLFGAILFVVGLAFALVWFLLVHFAHLPWWK